MNTNIPYGRDMVSFSLPEDKGHRYHFFSPNPVSPAPDMVGALRLAVENPIGCGPLESILSAGKTVNIICDDMTRPTPAADILRVILPIIVGAGVEKKDIKIIMALGSHRPMTDAEMCARVGEEIYSEFATINSEFKNPDGLIYMGDAEDGAEIWMCKEAMSSDIRIGIGSILPHPAMGWSGGGKILYPGVAAHDTVVKFHIRHGLSGENLYGMDDCPVRLLVENWVDTVGLHFVINTIMMPTGELYKAVAGHYVKAHREGVKYAKELFSHKVPYPMDVAITSSHPVDIDMWQAGKGINCSERILKDGGTVLLVTPCYEGVGPHPEFMIQCGNDKAEDVLRCLDQGNPIDGDPLALAVATTASRMRQRIRYAVYSEGLTREECEAGKMEYFGDLQDAVDTVLSRYANANVAIITHGGEQCLHL